MLTKTKIRNANREAVNKEDPKKTMTAKWEMSSFRHALFNIVENCKGFTSCTMKIDIANKLTICTLISRQKTFVCSYNYKKRTVKVVTLSDTKQITDTRTVLIKDFADYIKSNKPKLIIVRKVCEKTKTV
jgi:hypothetical protein